MKKIDLLDDRSDFVKEILETPPNNIISWGNTFFLIFLFLILGLSWVIKYPDIVTSNIILTTDNPPIFLSARTQGKIDTILKPNQAFVVKNDWLAVIGSNANLNHIRKLDTIIKKIRELNYDIEAIHELDLPILNVGEIQTNYNSLVKSVLKFKHHEEDGNFIVQESLNKLSINQYNDLIKSAIRDKEISSKELEMSKNDLDRHKLLLDKGVISDKDYEAIELSHLQAIKSLESNMYRITQIKSQKTSLISQGRNLLHSEDETYLNSKLDILEAIKLTELSFLEWKKEHVLISSVSGQINFLDYFSNNKNIELNEKLISIVPKYEDDDYFGIAKMPIINSGKVKKGQRANIKLHGFPYEEYGVVLGNVLDISEVPNEDFYLVKIKLENGLLTTYNREITFKQNINGSADIITEDLRMIERFVYTLTKAFR